MIANRDSIDESERFSRQAPGERDLQVYAAVRVDGRRQVEVAAEFGISQGRVSQIGPKKKCQEPIVIYRR